MVQTTNTSRTKLLTLKDKHKKLPKKIIHTRSRIYLLSSEGIVSYENCSPFGQTRDFGAVST